MSTSISDLNWQQLEAQLPVSDLMSLYRSTAPPINYVTPFPPTQRERSCTVLSQIYPDIGITSSAVILVSRMQDRLAHYMLLRTLQTAIERDKSGISSKESEKTSVTETSSRKVVSSSSSSKSKAGNDDDLKDEPDEDAAEPQAAKPTPPFTHLNVGFPASLNAPELVKHALNEAKLATSRIEAEGGEFEQVGLNFSAAIADRWINDFTRGLAVAAIIGPEAIKRHARRANREYARVLDMIPYDVNRPMSASVSKLGRQPDEFEEADEAMQEADQIALEEATKRVSEAPLNHGMLPDGMITYPTRVALCAVVEYFTAEWLEIAGQNCSQAGLAITPLDVWRGLAQDDELMSCLQFLSIDWNIAVSKDDDPFQPSEKVSRASSTSRNSFNLPTFLSMLDEEFSPTLKKVDELNKLQWYHDMTRVIETGKRFASGELIACPLTRSLRSYQVRPIRYYGISFHALLDEHLALVDDQQDAALNQSLFSRHRRAFAYILVSVMDSAGEDWNMLLEVSLRRRSAALIEDVLGQSIGGARTLDPAEMKDEEKEQAPSNNDHIRVSVPHSNLLSRGRQLKDPWSTSPCDMSNYHRFHSGVAAQDTEEDIQFDKEIEDQLNALEEKLKARMAATANKDKKPIVEEEESKQQAEPQSQSSTSAPGISPPDVFDPLSAFSEVYPSSSSSSKKAAPKPSPIIFDYANKNRHQMLCDHLSSMRLQLIGSETGRTLEGMLPNILHLARFGLYGPSLYVANQPFPARKAFTVSVIDTASQLSQLPTLPTVLLELIADYTPMDLPYLPDAAVLSLPSAKKAVRLPASRSMYVGQVENDIEKVSTLASEADHIFEAGGEEEDYDDDDGGEHHDDDGEGDGSEEDYELDTPDDEEN